MLSFSVGFLSFPVAPLVLIAAVWLGSAVAAGVARRRAGTGAGAGASDVLVHAALAGLVAARVGFVASNADAYAASPWSAIDVRDGGWHAPAGFAVGVAWIVWRALRRPSLRAPAAIGAVTATLAWMVASWALQPRDAPGWPTTALVGLDGADPTTLERAAAGRPAVVNLWATWCAPCRVEMPVLEAAQRREPGIAVLMVNQGESADRVRAFLRREGLTLREVLLDAGSAMGPAVQSPGLPTTLFYDAQGRRVGAHVGVLSDAVLRARMAALHTGR